MSKRFFNRADVEMMIERQEIKKRLKTLEASLKPKIAVACDELGDGAEVRVGGSVVTLKRIEATSISWQSIAESVADHDTIMEVKSLYTLDRVTRKAEVK